MTEQINYVQLLLAGTNPEKNHSCKKCGRSFSEVQIAIHTLLCTGKGGGIPSILQRN